jgi:hypothetical protein
MRKIINSKMCDDDCCAEAFAFFYVPLGLLLILFWGMFVYEPLVNGRFMINYDPEMALTLSLIFPFLASFYCCGLGAMLTCMLRGCGCRRRVSRSEQLIVSTRGRSQRK